MLPPGLFRLATRPRATGSEASWNTIGIVLVAALAAIADGAPATVTITATLRATKSATRAGNVRIASPPIETRYRHYVLRYSPVRQALGETRRCSLRPGAHGLYFPSLGLVMRLPAQAAAAALPRMATPLRKPDPQRTPRLSSLILFFCLVHNLSASRL